MFLRWGAISDRNPVLFSFAHPALLYKLSKYLIEINAAVSFSQTNTSTDQERRVLSVQKQPCRRLQRVGVNANAGRGGAEDSPALHAVPHRTGLGRGTERGRAGSTEVVLAPGETSREAVPPLGVRLGCWSICCRDAADRQQGRRVSRRSQCGFPQQAGQSEVTGTEGPTETGSTACSDHLRQAGAGN